MKKLLTTLAILSAVILLPATVSATYTPSISVPVNTIVRGEKGSIHKIAEVDIENEYVGMECSARATAKNQGSVHPNNNLIVKSNGTQVVINDVEREANEVTNAEGILKLGETLLVNLELGKDKVFSGGLDVELMCEKPAEIEVCRDNKVITITEEERLETDTDAPCPVEEPEEKPEVLPATTLPKTGPGAGVVGLVIAAGIMGTIVHSKVTRKELS